MSKKIRMIILASFLCLSFSLLDFPQVSAENRHILRKYGFNADGSLSGRLLVDFGSGERNVLAEKKQFAENKRILLLAFALDEREVFAKQIVDSRDYSLYKVSMRDSSREEIVVLGLGAVDGKKVQLREIYIVGEDDAGSVRIMPVKGFVPVNVLNTPLQLNRANSIVFPTQVGEKTLEVSWSAAGNEFVVGSPAGSSASTVSRSSAQRYGQSSDSSIEEDDSVFDDE